MADTTFDIDIVLNATSATIAELDNLAEKIKSSMDGAWVSAGDSALRSAKRQEDALDRAAVATEKAAQKQTQAAEKAAQDQINASQKVLAQNEKLNESYSKIATEGVNTFGNSLGRIAEIGLGISFANMFSDFIGGVKEAITGAFDFTASLEQTRIGFESLTQSADVTRSLLQELSDFSRTTPFKLPDLQEDAQTLLAIGINASHVTPLLDAFGNIAQGNTQKLKQMTSIFAQVASQGKLTGHTLLRLTMDQIPVLQQLEKQYGKTGAEITEMTRKGLIGSKDIQDAFFAMGEGTGRFAGSMSRQMLSFNGIMTNISDGLQILGRSFMGMTETGDKAGDAIAGGLFYKVKEAATSALSVINSFVALVQKKIDFNEFLRLAGITEQGRQNIFKMIGAVQTFGNIVKGVGGAIMTGLTSPLGQAVRAGTAFVLGFMRMRAMISGSIAIFNGLRLAVLGVGTPLLIAGAAAGLLYLAWQSNFGGIQETVSGFFNWAVAGFIQFATFINQNSRNIAQGTFGAVNGIINAWNNLMSYLIGPVIGTVTAFAAGILGGVGVIATGFYRAGQYIFKNFGGAIKSTVKLGVSSLKKLGNFVVDFGGGILQIFGGVGNFLKGAFLGDWDQMASGMIDIFAGTVGIVASIADGIVNVVINAINGAIGAINGMLSNPLVQKGLEMIGLGGAQIGLVGSSGIAGAMSGLGAGMRNDLGVKNKGYNEQGQQDFKKQFGGALDGFADNLDTDKISDAMGQAGDLIAGGTLGMIKGMSGFASTMLNNPPQLPQLQAGMVDRMTGVIGGMAQSVGNGLGQIGKVQLGAFGNPLDAIKGMFSGVQDYIDPNTGKVGDLISKQRSDMAGDSVIDGEVEGDGSPAKGKKRAGDKSAMDGIKEAADELRLKNEELALQKKAIDEQLKAKKEIGQEEINQIEGQKKQLENAEKLQKINEDSLKMDHSKSEAIQDQITAMEKANRESSSGLKKDTTKSDAIQDQIDELRRQKVISTNKATDRALELQILAKQQELSTQKDAESKSYDLAQQAQKDKQKQYTVSLDNLKAQLQAQREIEKGDYEAAKKIQDDQKDKYQKQLFDLNAQIDDKKSQLKKDLDKIQDQKDSLTADKIQLSQDKYLNDAKKYEIKYKMDYPEIQPNQINQSSTQINQNNNSRNTTNNNFTMNKFIPGFAI